MYSVDIALWESPNRKIFMRNTQIQLVDLADWRIMPGHSFHVVPGEYFSRLDWHDDIGRLIARRDKIRISSDLSRRLTAAYDAIWALLGSFPVLHLGFLAKVIPLAADT